MLSEKNLIRLFDFPLLGHHFIMPKVVKREGGQQESESLRRYYGAKYNISVGLYSYGCFDPELNYARGGEVIVGRYCSFAKGVRYFGANHPLNAVSMSPYFYNKSFGFEVSDVERSKLMVGNGVWCGYGVLITSKCRKIGNGAVVAAGSVVTQDVLAYGIYAGNPAKLIKYRFNEDTIEAIEKSKWWENNPETLIKYYDDMYKPIDFCRHFEI